MERKGYMEELKRSRKRYLALLILFSLLMIVCVVGKTIKIMFFKADYWKEVEKYSTIWNQTIPARRGNILSDEYKLLAGSMPQYDIHFDFNTTKKEGKENKRDQFKKDTLFNNYLESFASEVHLLVPKYSQQQLVQHYKRGKSGGKSHYVSLLPDGKAVDYITYQRLKQHKWLAHRYKGWFYSTDEKISRKKPFGTLAARTLGDLYGSLDSAKNGIELSFDSLLRGKNGIGHKDKIQNLSIIVPDVEPIDGCHVVTTINVEIQDIAENALRTQMVSLGAESGIAVVMETATGDIKALANLTRLSDGSYYETTNHAIKDLYEPGSTFKTVSLLIALDEGRIKVTDSVDAAHGSYKFYNAVMTDHNRNRGGYGILSVPEVLMYSSNIGTSRLIHAAYSSKADERHFIERVQSLMGNHFDLGLVGTAAPRIIPRYDDKTFVPWLSIGYNSQLPVINTVTFYNAIANGGKMVAPRLVTRVENENGSVREYPVRVVIDKICSDKALGEMQEILQRVVSDGLAKQAQSKFFSVAGKTGTAQVSQGAAGYKVGRTNYLLSFCGYFPADKPLYTCMVALRTVGGVASGGGLAGPVFHEISEKVMASRNRRDMDMCKDTLHNPLPTLLRGDLASAEHVLKSLGYRHEWSESELDYDRKSAWGSVTSDGKIVLTPHDFPDGLVPDVHGMGAQDALYLLEKLGMKVTLKGVGKVRSQSVRAGTRIKKGTRVELTLKM